MAKVSGDDTGLFGANGTALISTGAAHVALESVERGNAAQHPAGDQVCVAQVEKLTPDIGSAERQAHLLAQLGERGVAAIAIDLQDARKVTQVSGSIIDRFRATLIDRSSG